MTTAPSPSSALPAGPLAGLDPGRAKCGLVRTDPSCRRIVEADVLRPEDCYERLLHWHRQGLIGGVVMGNGTGSRAWRARLAGLLPVRAIDERNSTLEARRRYWQQEPPRGWRRLVPEGLRHPPRDWDDTVAQLLLERWLGHTLTRPPAQ